MPNHKNFNLPHHHPRSRRPQHGPDAARQAPPRRIITSLVQPHHAETVGARLAGVPGRARRVRAEGHEAQAPLHRGANNFSSSTANVVGNK